MYCSERGVGFGGSSSCGVVLIVLPGGASRRKEEAKQAVTPGAPPVIHVLYSTSHGKRTTN